MKIGLLLIACIVTMVGCARWTSKPLVYEDEDTVSLMLCEQKNRRVTVIRRFSFEVPPLLTSAPCGKYSSGFKYNKRLDSIYIGISGTFPYGNVEVQAAGYTLVVQAGLTGRPSFILPMDMFIQHELAYLSLEKGRRPYYPDEIEKLKIRGHECVLFRRHGYLPGSWMENLEYHCWEKESGMSIPFRLKVSQRVETRESAINMEEELIKPFFNSLIINRLSAEDINKAASSTQRSCRRQKDFFDKGEVFGTDFSDSRLNKAKLHFCGYDVPLPSLRDSYPDTIEIPDTFKNWEIN